MYRIVIHLKDAPLISVNKTVVRNGKKEKIQVLAPKTTVSEVVRDKKHEMEVLSMYTDNIKSIQRKYG